MEKEIKLAYMDGFNLGMDYNIFIPQVGILKIIQSAYGTNLFYRQHAHVFELNFSNRAQREAQLRCDNLEVFLQGNYTITLNEHLNLIKELEIIKKESLNLDFFQFRRNTYTSFNNAFSRQPFLHK